MQRSGTACKAGHGWPLWRWLWGPSRSWAARPAPTADNLYPTETFTDTWRTSIGDETIRARFYGQAHTSGDVTITFEDAPYPQADLSMVTDSEKLERVLWALLDNAVKFTQSGMISVAARRAPHTTAISIAGSGAFPRRRSSR